VVDDLIYGSHSGILGMRISQRVKVCDGYCGSNHYIDALANFEYRDMWNWFCMSKYPTHINLLLLLKQVRVVGKWMRVLHEDKHCMN